MFLLLPGVSCSCFVKAELFEEDCFGNDFDDNKEVAGDVGNDADGFDNKEDDGDVDNDADDFDVDKDADDFDDIDVDNKGDIDDEGFWIEINVYKL